MPFATATRLSSSCNWKRLTLLESGLSSKRVCPPIQQRRVELVVTAPMSAKTQRSVAAELSQAVRPDPITATKLCKAQTSLNWLYFKIDQGRSLCVHHEKCLRAWKRPKPTDETFQGVTPIVSGRLGSHPANQRARECKLAAGPTNLAAFRLFTCQRALLQTPLATFVTIVVMPP
jgi:hypothetical protein